MRAGDRKQGINKAWPYSLHTKLSVLGGMPLDATLVHSFALFTLWEIPHVFVDLQNSYFIAQSVCLTIVMFISVPSASSWVGVV